MEVDKRLCDARQGIYSEVKGRIKACPTNQKEASRIHFCQVFSLHA